jgi:hypothetical protein
VLRWAVLAAVARANLTVARVLEAHTDALAILAEARDEPPSGSTWGVFAAEAPGDRLEAHVHPARGWVARGLRTVISVPVEFDHAPALAVGDPGWYLIRPGFAWGGIGVAACWYGGAVGVADAVLRAAGRSPSTRRTRRASRT